MTVFMFPEYFELTRMPSLHLPRTPSDNLPCDFPYEVLGIGGCYGLRLHLFYYRTIFVRTLKELTDHEDVHSLRNSSTKIVRSLCGFPDDVFRQRRWLRTTAYVFTL